MIGRDDIRLEVGTAGVSVWRGDAELLSAIDAATGDGATLQAALKPLCGDQPSIDVLLHPPFILDLRLGEEDGIGTLAMTDILALHAPLLPDALVWTGPRAMADGHVAVSIAKRDWITGFAALLTQAGLPAPLFRAGPDGSPLDQRAQSGSDPPGTLLFALLVILTMAMAALAFSTWRERQMLEAQSSAATAVAERTVPQPPLRDQPTLAKTVSRLPRLSGPAARWTAIERGEDGQTNIEIDTADPDLLRQSIRTDPSLRMLREGKQAQRPDGRYRVRYSVGGAR